jgi:hypothetical protein
MHKADAALADRRRQQHGPSSCLTVFRRDLPLRGPGFAAVHLSNVTRTRCGELISWQAIRVSDEDSLNRYLLPEKIEQKNAIRGGLMTERSWLRGQETLESDGC